MPDTSHPPSTVPKHATARFSAATYERLEALLAADEQCLRDVKHGLEQAAYSFLVDDRAELLVEDLAEALALAQALLDRIASAKARVATSLVGADLSRIKADLYRVLSKAPAEAPGLLAALKEGRVNGSVYSGPCACLKGTLANVRGMHVDEFTSLVGLDQDASEPAEAWFLAIRKGHTAEKSQIARITIEWIEAWLAEHPSEQPKPATEEPANV